MTTPAQAANAFVRFLVFTIHRSLLIAHCSPVMIVRRRELVIEYENGKSKGRCQPWFQIDLSGRMVNIQFDNIWTTFVTWDASTKVAVITLILAIIGGVCRRTFSAVNWIQRKRLEGRIDTDSYPVEVIENSTKYYVRSNCSSVDPTQESEIRHLVATTEDLFQYIDKFRNNALAGRHLLVLADSGMGKTSFVLNYFQSRSIGFQLRKKKLAVVYLGTKHAISQIRALQDQKSIDIILDAFDEDTSAIDNYRDRMAEILAECQFFRRVIITCRTQFFPRSAEIPVETGIVRVEPRTAGAPGQYELYKVYLAPLTDRQVYRYLIKRYGFFSFRKRWKAQNVVNRIPLLSVRPMILSYIPDLIETEQPIGTALQLYDVLIDRWLERESNWVDKNQLRVFSEKLAIDLFVNRKARGSERISRAELLELAGQLGVELEEWKLTGRSLLNRDANGNHKFAHRSIMEYLLIKGFIEGSKAIRGKRWTDMMKSFYVEYLKSNSYYFSSSVVRSEDTILEKFDGVDLSELDISSLAATLQMYCSLRNANLNGVQLVGMDLTSSIFTGASLCNADLTRSKCITTNMREADMSAANLTKTNFTNADLSSCKLVGAHLAGTKFMRTNLSHADLRNSVVEDADFWESNLFETDLRGVDLRKARGLALEQIEIALTDMDTQVPTSAITESRFKELMSQHPNLSSTTDPYEE